MSLIIRGGQTTLHYIRMLRQITLSILKIGLLIVTGFTVYSIYKSPITIYDLEIFAKFYFFKVASHLGDNTSSIIHNGKIISLVHYINSTIYESFTQGIKYGIIASILVTIIFAIKGLVMTRKKVVRGKEILSSSKLRSKIFFYNSFKNLLNLENHLRFIGNSLVIFQQSFLLIIKSFRNFPITFSRIIALTFCNVWGVIRMICPDLIIRIIAKIKFKINPDSKLGRLIKRISIISEVNINNHIRLVIKATKRIISLYTSIKLANIPYPKGFSHTHTLITGGSGTGKTILMSNLIHQIRAKNQKAIIYDKMGVFTKNFYDPETDIILNPLDERSHNWDLTKECKTRSHCDNIATAFIPSRSSNSDPFWDNASKMLLSEVIYKSENLDDLINALFKDEERLKEIIQGNVALKNILAKNAGKTSASIMAVFYSYVKSLQLLENSLRNGFSIRDWAQDDNQKGFLIISSKADSQETLKPLLTAIFETAINSILSLKQDPSRNLWVFLDELPSLQYIPSLQSALAESRQFGASFVLALQVMSQLKDIYGIQKAESVSGLCRTRVVFSTPDEDTANWCSNSLGKVEVEEMKESFSYGSNDMRDGVNINKQISIKHLALPTEIMNLENLNCYLRFGSGFGVTKIQLPITKYIAKAESFVEQKNIVDVLSLDAISESIIDALSSAEISEESLGTEEEDPILDLDNSDEDEEEFEEENLAPDDEFGDEEEENDQEEDDDMPEQEEGEEDDFEEEEDLESSKSDKKSKIYNNF